MEINVAIVLRKVFTIPNHLLDSRVAFQAFQLFKGF